MLTQVLLSIAQANMAPPGAPIVVAAVEACDEEDMDMSWSSKNVPIAIGISIGAGLATAIGGALVFFPEFLKRVPQAKVLGVSLAVSAGVMLYVSFIEIFAKSLDAITNSGCECADRDRVGCSFSEGSATAITTVCFFSGMLCCVALEYIVHKMNHGPHACDHVGHGQPQATTTATPSQATTTATSTEGGGTHAKVEVFQIEVGLSAPPTSTGFVHIDEEEKERLRRMGIMTAAAIAIHNFPEGLPPAPLLCLFCLLLSSSPSTTASARTRPHPPAPAHIPPTAAPPQLPSI